MPSCMPTVAETVYAPVVGRRHWPFDATNAGIELRVVLSYGGDIDDQPRPQARKRVVQQLARDKGFSLEKLAWGKCHRLCPTLQGVPQGTLPTCPALGFEDSVTDYARHRLYPEEERTKCYRLCPALVGSPKDVTDYARHRRCRVIDAVRFRRPLTCATGCHRLCPTLRAGNAKLYTNQRRECGRDAPSAR
jgi:hypothetical protein